MSKKNVCIYQIAPEEAYYRTEEFIHHQLAVVELINNTPGWRYKRIYLDNRGCRAAFAEMMDDCNNGGIDIIVTKSLHSFAESASEAMRIIKELLSQEPSVEVLFTDEALFSTDREKLTIFEEGCRYSNNSMETAGR